MQPDFLEHSSHSPPNRDSADESYKPPRPILENIFAFPPNRDTLGATAYFIVEKSGNVLLDSPGWSTQTAQFLQSHGGIRWLFLTHRGGIGSLNQLQSAFDCEVIIQEQEAYLIPEIKVTSFERDITLAPGFQGIWTPGHSPGSSCFYCRAYGGVLFTGRHLVPNQQGEPTPLRTAKTFHWLRQLRSVQALCDRFNSQTLNTICPGANTGFLRGKGAIAQAYPRLLALDLEALQHSPIFF